MGLLLSLVFPDSNDAFTQYEIRTRGLDGTNGASKARLLENYSASSFGAAHDELYS
jgi:hypothetical protein